MRPLLFIAVLFLVHPVFAQCPFAVTLTTTGSCPGAVLTVNTSNTITKIEWWADSRPVATVTVPPNGAPISKTYTTTATGDYTAYVTDAAGCRTMSNYKTISASMTAAVSVSQSAATLCSNTPVFTAVPVSGGSTPVYQWLVNGLPAGANTPTFTGNNLQQGDKISCILSNNTLCVTNPTTISNVVVASVPPSAVLSNTGTACAGSARLLVNSPDPLAQIVWKRDGAPVSTALATPPSAGYVMVAGGRGPGSGSNQITAPQGIAVDAAGNLYVSDGDGVQKWAPGATSFVYVAKAGLTATWGIFVDASGYIYVCSNESIVRFPPNSTGATPGVVVAGTYGGGSGANQLNKPRSVFVNASGYIYVADAGNQRVQKFPPGSTSATAGVTIASNLGNPTGVFVDAAGNVYILESAAAKVTKWAPGASAGVVVAGGNGPGAALNQFSNPSSLYVDADGNIYVADSYNYRIQKWAPGASAGVTMAGGHGSGNASNQLTPTGGIYVDADGAIYATDSWWYGVKKYEQNPTIDKSYQALMPGTYTAVISTSSGCPGTSNSIVVQPNVSPSISIGASATGVCSGTNITFTATSVNGGGTTGGGGAPPDYQWVVNRVNTGSNDPVYASSTLNNEDAVSCVVTSHAECPLVATAVSNTIPVRVNPTVTPSLSISGKTEVICSGQPATFAATPVNGGAAPVYQWQVNEINTGTNSPNYVSNALADGDVINCVMVSDAACTDVANASSNSIRVKVHPLITPVVNILTSTPVLCAGDAVRFTATVVGGGENPAYQWLVNGVNVGDGGASLNSNAFSNGDDVICRYTSSAGCGDASSNDIRLVVNPLPEVADGQIIIQAGQSIPLLLQATGDITGYAWSPGDAFSDSTMANPLVTPEKNTIYTLVVTTAEGCKASGNLTVNVLKELRIPTAFTPNGDGKNDIFYVLGGPAGTKVKDLAVYNRSGWRVFQVHGAPPGDPAFGWNGAGAPGGAYVYVVTMQFKDGSQQVLRGTVVLVR